MLLDRNQLRDSRLQDTNVSLPKSAKGQFLSVGWLHGLDIPVQQTTESSCNECNRQVGGKSENQRAQSRAKEAHQEDRLATNLVAQSSPNDSCRKLGQSECGRDHAGVDGNLALVFGDVEVFDHLIDVGEDGHERNRFAYSAERWLKSVLAGILR